MTHKILDGKRLAAELRQEIGQRAATFADGRGRAPSLVAVLVGEDPASQVYIRNKERACARANVSSQVLRLPDSISQNELADRIGLLNDDANVDGVLVQLPLPDRLDSVAILDAVDPSKDVDCFHPENVGLLMQGRPRFLPCTPHGCLQLLERNGLTCRGKHVVVVGRSDIVGKPLAAMVVQRSLAPLSPDTVNATVTCCHSQSQDLTDILRSADIVIAAVGRPKMVTAAMISPGAVVVDVGINRTDDGLVGDVDFAAVEPIASHITPVPGGVGPLTVAMLLWNTLQAAEARRQPSSGV